MLTNDEFYIGYETNMPAGVRRAVRRTVATAIAIVMLLAGVATAIQVPLPAVRFEFGRRTTYRGWLTHSPIPTLHVISGTKVTRYWLVAPGKFGVQRVIDADVYGAVELDGVLIEREHWRMLEVQPGAIRQVSGIVAPPEPSDVRSTHVTLRGEIVDSKCFLGVMNPGSHAAHRDCAVRCSSGGIPMMFAYRDAAGPSHLAMLMSAAPAGRHLQALVGTTTELEGRLVTDGDLEVLVVEEP